MTEERRTPMRDRRRSSVLPIELKTSIEKKPVVKIVIEQRDSRGDEDENESNFKEDEQNQVHQGAKVEEKLGSDDKVTVQLNTPYSERYINSSQSKSSLQSLESFTSFESNESSLVESEDDTNVQDEIIATPKPDLGDRVINALIVKRRKMMIDQDEEDVISYEESEIRIINFLLGLGIIFSIVICPLLFLHFQRNFQSTMEDKSTVLKELQLNFLEPKLTLLYKSTGMINTFVWKNQTLTKEWDKPLPSSTDYFPYFDNGYLNIIYGDGAKGMTYIDVKSPRNCHRVLPAGKLKHQILSSKNLQDTPEFYLDMQSLRVGNYLIWFGGRETHFLQTQSYQIFLWNIKRHKWYKGINLPSGIGGYTDDTWTYNSLGYSTEHMCGVGVNDTTAVFFGKKVAYNDTCLSCNEHVFDWEDTLTKFTLDLTTGKWVEIDTKFHSFSDVDNAILTNPIFACDSTFSKTSDVDIVISISIRQYLAWDKFLYILVVNWKSSAKRIIEMEKPGHLVRYDTNHISNSLLLFVTNGIPYHLIPIIENSDVQLHLYEINLQTDTIKLAFKMSNYTLMTQGLKVVPFIGSNNIHDHNHICKI